MKINRILLIALLLLGATIFITFRYIATLREKQALSDSLNQIKLQVAALQNEKQSLLQTLEKEKQLGEQLNTENRALREDLNNTEEKLTKFKSGFIQSYNKIKQLNSRLAALKEANILLKDERNHLNKQLSEVTQERDALKIRFSSITELRKAIRELRSGRSDKMSAEGNRGFIIKDGKPTYPTRVKIEVIPTGKE